VNEKVRIKSEEGTGNKVELPKTKTLNPKL
jgi:hypothetical protein